MRPVDIIKRAILSEKAYKQMAFGVYTFLVDRRATKKEIAKTVESQFGVSVYNVNIANFAPKKRRIAGKRRKVEVGGGRKAIVKLMSGQSIALLQPVSEAKSKSKTVKTKTKKDDKS